MSVCSVPVPICTVFAQNCGTTLGQVRPVFAQSASVSQHSLKLGRPHSCVSSMAVTVVQDAAAWVASHAPEQACALHGCVSTVLGHPRPPHDADVTIDRVRVCVPPPQAAEHAEKALQSETTQSTGA